MSVAVKVKGKSGHVLKVNGQRNDEPLEVDGIWVVVDEIRNVFQAFDRGRLVRQKTQDIANTGEPIVIDLMPRDQIA